MQQEISFNSKVSKTNEILHALKQGDQLTGKDIWLRFGVYRASSVIHRLRRRGYTINREMVPGKNGESYARYSLKQIIYRVKIHDKEIDISYVLKEATKSMHKLGEAISREATETIEKLQPA
jgi:isocitrate dehydrogenase kinase/phosphatase